MKPENEFEVKSRTWRREIFPKNGEILPCSFWLTRETEMTCEELSQAMPDQLQWWDVLIQFLIAPFGSRVMEFLKAFRASTSTSSTPNSAFEVIGEETEKSKAIMKNEVKLIL